MAVGPLAGLRVVEVATYVAAPLAGMTLAQLGAEVVRVDPLGGAADTGRWPLAESGTSLFWTGLNKGKKSLLADLRSTRGRQLVGDLVASCPTGTAVLLTNAVGQEWLSYDAMSQHAGDLIHVQIEGLAGGGAAIDYTVNAATGFPHVTGPVAHPDPVNHVLPAWDLACGLHAALAVAAAARHRERSGQGQRITIALADVALAMAGNLGFLAEAQVNGVNRERVGNYLYGSFGRDFTCRDGRVMVVALTPRHWNDLLSATGTGDRVGQLEQVLGVDFTDESDRYRHREALCHLMEPWFASRTLAQVAQQLRGTSVVWAPYRGFPDVVAALQAGTEPSRIFRTITQPGVGEYLAPGSPIWVDGDHAPAVPAPALGEHTRSVLQGWLGMSVSAADGLLATGVVADQVTKYHER